MRIVSMTVVLMTVVSVTVVSMTLHRRLGGPVPGTGKHRADGEPAR